ncbi:hypothetical protein [Echinicola pacifica]|uniref:hypothetical protein n=2 Tax=Echinicola pacifica TaxID=346377 RepID=UPI00167B3AE1|nr:hypothetical protein [Echinicola pacifica]
MDDDNDGILDVNEGKGEITEFGYKEDILIAGYHGVIGRTTEGDVMAWGEFLSANGKDHLKYPTKLTPANGYNYQGEILKYTYATATIYAAEAVILTDAGLYSWGSKTGPENASYYYVPLIPETMRSRFSTHFAKVINTSTYNFGTVTNQYSLPADYTPSDVENLYGVYHSLFVVTKDGKLWVLGDNENNYGDNSGVVDSKWHQVQLPPGEEVYKIRASIVMVFIQTKSGDLYTWGTQSILGDGSPETNRVLPTKMVNPLPPNEKIIQIAGNTNTYYILSSEGYVYSMGKNNFGQTGRGLYLSATGENHHYDEWGKVTNEDGSYLENVRFLSADDGGGSQTAAVILEDKSVRAWGHNDQYTIGGVTNYKGYNYPIIPTGTEGQEYSYVETGGHITPIIKADGSYCNVGHDLQFSFGDGSSNDERIPAYQCILPPGTFSFEASRIVEEQSLDTDNDGFPNYLDVDSDNDGCPDAKEAGLINYISSLNNPSANIGEGNMTVGGGTPREYGTNGFYNLIEDADNSEAVYTGVYTYEPAIDESIDSECLVVQKEVYSNPAMRSIKYRQKN